MTSTKVNGVPVLIQTLVNIVTTATKNTATIFIYNVRHEYIRAGITLSVKSVL